MEEIRHVFRMQTFLEVTEINPQASLLKRHHQTKRQSVN